MIAGLLAAALVLQGTAGSRLEEARNKQDRQALEQIASQLDGAAQQKLDDGPAQYQAARAYSYLAQVALEVGDKAAAARAAEQGIRRAERAVELGPRAAEHHRILGTLCGQVIPANLMLGLKYGNCALTAIDKALELDPKSALAWVSRGVGKYYLPPAFGGGVEPAIADFQKAISLNPDLAEAHLWLGVALRKAHRDAEARHALEHSLRLNPDRLWAKQQLEKTPTP